jgi:hypothetical protein
MELVGPSSLWPLCVSAFIGAALIRVILALSSPTNRESNESFIIKSGKIKKIRQSTINPTMHTMEVAIADTVVASFHKASTS